MAERQADRRVQGGEEPSGRISGPRSTMRRLAYPMREHRIAMSDRASVARRVADVRAGTRCAVVLIGRHHPDPFGGELHASLLATS